MGRGAGRRAWSFRRGAKWESALDELATLDFDGARVEFERRLAEGGKIAGGTTFAPESREAQVQVMGPWRRRECVRCGVVSAGGDLWWPMEAQGIPCCLGRCGAIWGCLEWTRLGIWRGAKGNGADWVERGTVMFSYARETTGWKAASFTGAGRDGAGGDGRGRGG